jgi:acyl carrier protein
LEAPTRILASGSLSQVAVTADDLRIRHARAATYQLDALGQQLQASAVRGDSGPSEQAAVPASDIESRIADIWRDVLGTSTIGINDNFYDLGGDSLIATRIASQLKAVFQVPLDIRAVFATSTVAEQALLVEELLLDEVEQLDGGVAAGL